jgi:hypothetical protein
MQSGPRSKRTPDRRGHRSGLACAGAAQQPPSRSPGPGAAPGRRLVRQYRRRGTGPRHHPAGGFSTTEKPRRTLRADPARPSGPRVTTHRGRDGGRRVGRARDRSRHRAGRRRGRAAPSRSCPAARRGEHDDRRAPGAALARRTAHPLPGGGPGTDGDADRHQQWNRRPARAGRGRRPRVRRGPGCPGRSPPPGHRTRPADCRGPADHPWARLSRPVSARQLATTPLVTRESGSGTPAAPSRRLCKRCSATLRDSTPRQPNSSPPPPSARQSGPASHRRSCRTWRSQTTSQPSVSWRCERVV